jgi:AcrR family transcriptional regulator
MVSTCYNIFDYIGQKVGGAVNMLDKFEKLDQKKQEKIRRSAMQIFADKGFKDASTNKIVETAGISKGTLFYYFENKKGLYYYLIDYALSVIKEEYINHIDHTTLDFIERMSNNSKIKYQYFQKYPEVNYFLSTVLYSELKTLPETYQQKFKELIAYTKNKIDDKQTIQEDLFKEEHNPKEASRIIRLTIEGYFSELAAKFKQQPLDNVALDPLWDDFDELLETLRDVFYKNKEEKA